LGWACQRENRASIDVHIYAGGAAGGKPPGTFLTGGKADLDNEPAVDRDCQDANGGKHRFKIELPNQLLRTFQRKSLFAHGIAVVGNVENAAIRQSGKFQLPSPKWPPDPPTPNFLDGPPVAAFDTGRDSCELIDIADAAARAFRDNKGTTHLIASHYVTRAGLGLTLGTAKHNCQVVYRSRHDGNPADFDDATWLTQFYSVDGKQIVAFGHMEYHGWEHAGMRASKTDAASCRYNVSTFLTSNDGGYHFASPKPPANYLVSLPYKYRPNQGPEGYSADLSLLKIGDWYYSAVYSWAWPPNCGQNQMLRRETEGNWSYAYFSPIDPSSKDLSYGTITDHPYLYYVRMDGYHPPYQRVLFRQRVKLDWMIKAAAAEWAAHPTTPPKQ
jgi:hypothetical protein